LNVTGRVTKIFDNSKNGRGNWKVMIEDANGQKAGFGTFNDPGPIEGAAVSFNAAARQGTGQFAGKTFWNIDGAITVTSAAPPQASPMSPAGGAVDYAAKDKRIQFQHAQKVAADLLDTLSKNDVINLSKAKVGDRLEVAMGMFADLTEDVYNNIGDFFDTPEEAPQEGPAEAEVAPEPVPEAPANPFGG
jgi:hypothetical protein